MTLRRFKTILIDPPTMPGQKGRSGASHHYELLTEEKLATLPIDRLAEPNSHLYVWTTNAAMEMTFRLIRAWNAEPRSILTWTKPRLGLGNYLRNSSEHLIFATRGKAPVHFKSQPSWLMAGVQDHSHKPEEQYAIIERVSGSGDKLEIFARRRPPEFPDSHWYVWGNEVASEISLADYGWRVPSDSPEESGR